MKKIRLTETELTNVIKRIISEEKSSKDLHTLLHSLRNSINDGDKKESISKINHIIDIVVDMDDKKKKDDM